MLITAALELIRILIAPSDKGSIASTNMTLDADSVESNETKDEEIDDPNIEIPSDQLLVATDENLIVWRPY